MYEIHWTSFAQQHLTAGCITFVVLGRKSLRQLRMKSGTCSLTEGRIRPAAIHQHIDASQCCRDAVMVKTYDIVIVACCDSQDI